VREESKDGFSLLPEHNDTSSMLDALRWGGAQAVCVGHALSFFGVGDNWRPPNYPYMQNIGVLVFFVLSGFVIAHALVRAASRPEGGLGTFVVDRFARIYTALLPAMILIALGDGLLLWYGRHEHPSYVTASAFLGTLGMFQNYSGLFKGLLAVPSFGSAGHLWSLAVEWHIYLFAGGLFFALSGRKWLPALLLAFVFSAVPLEFFGSLKQGAHGHGLSYLWLLGFGAYFLARTDVARFIPVKVLGLITIVVSCCWIATTTPAAEYDPKLYPLLAVAFLMLVLMTQRTRLLVGRPAFRLFVRRLADYSFSLYLIHYSLLYALHILWKESPVLAAGIGVVACNVIAWGLASQTEWRHREFASWLKRILGVGRKVPVASQ
jgi:peptidoglycan/LPS O-acetylase OafA/YrhL